MGKEVNAAIGAQRQFAKQPELPYALRLNDINASRGISQSVDYDAQRLASALGAAPKAIGVALEAIDKRKQENAKTLVNADEILAGKTKKDLQTFDAMIALQNVQGHNLSHNKYAMAILEQGMGRMASTYAKQELADMPEFQRPKSVEEAVGLFRQKLDENYQLFGDNIHNREAFNEGYYNEGIRDTLKVANEADQRINDVKKQQMVMLGSTDLQDAIMSGISGEEFKNVADLSLKKIMLGTTSPREFLQNVAPLLGVITENSYTTDRLNAIGDFEYEGKKVRDLTSLAPFYKKIAANFDKRVAEDLYNKCLMPDGTLNTAMFNAELDKLPKEFTTPGIPQIDIPSNNVTLSGMMQEVAPSVGGILSMLGVGDAMSVTSATGDSMSVYVGTISKDTKDRISNNMLQAFNGVSFTDDGESYTLHLSGYKGGLDNKADNAEISASAYSPDRIENIRKRVRAMNADRTRKMTAAKQAGRKKSLSSIVSSTNQEEALKAIEDSDFPPEQKQYLEGLVEQQYRPLTKRQQALMTKEAKGFYDYIQPTTAGLPSQFARDLKLMDTLNEMSEDEKESMKDEDLNKYIKASKRIDAYNAYCDRVYKSDYDLDTASGEAEDIATQPTYDDIKKELSGAINKWRQQGMSDADISDRLQYGAKNLGLSLEEANRLENELLGGM